MLHKQMPPVDKCLSRPAGKVEESPSPKLAAEDGDGAWPLFFPGKTAGYRGQSRAAGRGKKSGGKRSRKKADDGWTRF